MARLRFKSAATLGGVQIYRYAAAMGGSDVVPLSGDCTAPRILEVQGAESDLLSRLRTFRETELDYADGYGFIGQAPAVRPQKVASALLAVRCRKCDACLKKRSHQWAARARVEILASQRNWFGTLTVDPDRRFLLAEAARKRIRSRLSEDSSAQLYGELVRLLNREATLMLKRLRTGTGAKLRYLLVWEAHKDGFPHAHVLVHEIAGTVTKRALEKEWRFGFSHWRLVDSQGANAAFYVAKYLAKDARARVRASFRYGRDPEGRLTERLLAVTREVKPLRNDANEPRPKEAT